MQTAIKELKPIPANPPRWKPSADPSSITVVGLDITASVSEQIDQIDQLITMKLQDIDADFSKMQKVLSNRILPAFKRYSIGTEPVREAAKFWTSFYEQAAQVRIPTYDLSSLQETTSAVPIEGPHASSFPEDLSTPSGSNTNTLDLNRTPSESSFLPAHAAVSSTPAAMAARPRGANDASFTPIPSATEPSWGMSIESPLVRLDRELRDFARPDPQPASTSASIDIFSEADVTVGPVTAVPTDETMQAPTPAPAPSSTRGQRFMMQTRVEHSMPNPATPARNPYLPARTDPRNWSGIVDLRAPQPAPSLSATDKDDDPTLPMGMSPPVMVPFATLPSLGRSPAKSAATNIRRALVRHALRGGGGDSNVSASGTGSSVASPPSLTRYTRDASTSYSSANLASVPEIENKHGWDYSATSTSTSTASMPNKSLSTPPYYTTPARAPAYAHEVVHEPPETPLPPSSGGDLSLVVGGGVVDATIDATPESDDASTTSTFSSSGEDSVHNTAHPSAAFLLASRQRGWHDRGDHDEADDGDDFDDSLDTDVDADATAALAPVHPFARARAMAAHDDAGEYDDSFDSFSFDGSGGDEGERPEETVFGVRPAVREAAQPRLRMLGDELLQDTIGYGDRRGRAGLVEESPTPWGGGSGGHGG